MIRTNDFDYFLPKELIAQTPLNKRDESRLLILDRKDNSIKHKVFSQITQFLQPKDVLVLNNTRVMPARIFGRKADTGARIEVLLLHKVSHNKYEALVRPGRRVKLDTELIFSEGELTARVVGYKDFGGRILEFQFDGFLEQILEKLGETPLPPYINTHLEDPERYQTVYNKHWGSAAAPTAGLHFTEEILEKLKTKGINIAEVLLHVGLGTFRPVDTEYVEEHKMHKEYFRIEAEAIKTINQAKAQGGRVIAVGTTTVRVLETLMQRKGELYPSEGWTDIFIYPGYQFKSIDALLTNFHLPKSSLLMLVSAFAGSELTQRAYQDAIEHEYRFFSFGDAMLIL